MLRRSRKVEQTFMNFKSVDWAGGGRIYFAEADKNSCIRKMKSHNERCTILNNTSSPLTPPLRWIRKAAFRGSDDGTEKCR